MISASLSGTEQVSPDIQANGISFHAKRLPHLARNGQFFPRRRSKAEVRRTPLNDQHRAWASFAELLGNMTKSNLVTITAYFASLAVYFFDGIQGKLI
jgi:hypothetical protein